MSKQFNIGDRVVLKGHSEFPDGTTGTVSVPPQSLMDLAEPAEWKEHHRTVQALKGPILFYFVEFDEPTDDGSGDGPYAAASIDENSLFRRGSNG